MINVANRKGNWSAIYVFSVGSNEIGDVIKKFYQGIE